MKFGDAISTYNKTAKYSALAKKNQTKNRKQFDGFRKDFVDARNEFESILK
ncbi:MAG: hypothetical protein LBT09_04395 [Planctomycetaceae bacterium]|nr:hypothetical protein [Planctomycetaceae bacterium]